MAKRSHEDSKEKPSGKAFLPPRQLFVNIDTPVSAPVKALVMSAKVEKAKTVLAKAKIKRGPKKGTGGRPPKDGPVAKRTQQWRKKKDS